MEIYRLRINGNNKLVFDGTNKSDIEKTKLKQSNNFKVTEVAKPAVVKTLELISSDDEVMAMRRIPDDVKFVIGPSTDMVIDWEFNLHSKPPVLRGGYDF